MAEPAPVSTLQVTAAYRRTSGLERSCAASACGRRVPCRDLRAAECIEIHVAILCDGLMGGVMGAFGNGQRPIRRVRGKVLQLGRPSFIGSTVSEN